ncbi:MAG: zinc ABC transporter substrate-binding protein, partial [bacterium]|nr:zinc ABC transporter substrate-binding protein [bacterium]
MNNLYKILILLIILTAGLWLASSMVTPTESNEPSGAINVVTSFYPLAYFSQAIGGDLVNVTNLVPAGAEPHDYQPTPQDITNIHKANLFVYNGGGIDAWASQTEEGLHESSVTVLEMITHIDGLLEIDADHGHEDDHEEDVHDGEHAETFDEHFWLDP